MSRSDLLALTPDAVAALSNRGLVKRALKELAAGKGPELSEQDDGTVVGRFPDGVETRLEVGTTLRDTPCSCPAITVCRHRVSVALGYASWLEAQQGRPSAAEQPGASDAEPPLLQWSPGTIDDETLATHLGKRGWNRARAARRKGYVAEVLRPSVEDPVPTAALATCTVRFLVPHELSFVHCDSAEQNKEFVALAVWAFREADARDPDAARLEVEVAATAPGTRRSPSGALEPSLSLAKELLLEGVIHSRPSLAGQFEQARRELVKAKLVWPALAFDELDEQLQAYRARSARYRPSEVAGLLAELHARARAAQQGTGAAALRVLGTEESLETRLDHVRLVSLGARLSGDGPDRRAEVALADPDTATVLVMRRDYHFDDAEDALDGTELGRRLFAPRTTLARVAGGQIVTVAARRRANRLLVLGQSRVARTSVTPSRGDWEILPAPLHMGDYAALERALAERPPRMVRPRVLADGVHVVEVAEVAAVGYHAAEQRMVATVLDSAGHQLRLALDHRRAAPGALDALAQSLTGDQAVRFVSGTVRRIAGGLELEPLAVVTDRLWVLDLEPAGQDTELTAALADEPPSPLAAAIDSAAELLAEGAHQGLRRAPAAYGEQLGRCSAALLRLGLETAAARIHALGDALVEAQATGQARAERTAALRWVDAMIRIRLAQEAL